MDNQPTTSATSTEGALPPALCSAVLAFDVTIYEYSCIVFAKNAAQARWRAVKGWRDAGFGGHRQWPSVKASRNPRYDGFYRKHEGRCWDPQYVRDVSPEPNAKLRDAAPT